MAKHIWSVTCQNAIVDKHTNLVSYINSFDQIGIPELPYAFPPLVVASLWERESDEEDLVIKIEVIAPDGEVKKEKELSDIKFNSNFHRTHVRISPFEINQAGEFKIIIKEKTKKKWKKVKELPIIIDFQEKEEAK